MIAKTTDITDNLSQVNHDKNPWLQKPWLHGLIIAVVVLLLSVFVFSGHTKNRTHKQQTVNLLGPNYQEALDKNLASLHQEYKQLSHEITIPKTFQSSGLKSTVSREYKARQNAPTTMYNAGDNSVISGSQASHISQATFMGQGVYSQWGNQNVDTTAVTAKKILHPESTIASGEFIHAVLETAINSDLPGMVRAVIADPVYAYVGNKPLIPAGSRLVGQYSSKVFQGINRVFVMWNRVILPNGVALQINSPGTDNLGRAGISADSVNTHFFSRFGEATLLSVIGAGVANVGVDANDRYNSAAEYRAAVAQSFQESAKDSLKNNLATKPTLNIHQGARIVVFVAHDLSFYAVLAREK